MAQWQRILLPMQETWVWPPNWQDPLEKEMPTHSSNLAWKNPMDRGACLATVHRVANSQTWLSDWTTTISYIYVCVCINIYVHMYHKYHVYINIYVFKQEFTEITSLPCFLTHCYTLEIIAFLQLRELHCEHILLFMHPASYFCAYCPTLDIRMSRNQTEDTRGKIHSWFGTSNSGLLQFAFYGLRKLEAF